MEKTFVRLTATVLATSMLAVPVIFGNGNPSGTGQPNADCETSTDSPPGFSTGGFEKAEEHYAGEEGSATENTPANDHAVSQYDVACYQISNP